jgi:hypothetical protein
MRLYSYFTEKIKLALLELRDVYRNACKTRLNIFHKQFPHFCMII